MLLKNLWCEKMSLRGCVAAAAVSGMLVLAACGGDSGTSVSSGYGTSDSEEIQSSSSSQKRSSSSQKISSSSSLKKVSSSSKKLSSSSSQILSSSSSLKTISSSSKLLNSSSSLISSSSSSLKSVSSSSKLLSSSSSSLKAESSSSSKGEVKSSSSNHSSSSSEKKDEGWSWDVPKEARLNPEIAYDSITDSRDGQIYKTVKIGDQVWMAENLNYYDTTLNDRSWCYGAPNSFTTENCAVTGRLYTWAAAIDSVKLATDKENPQDCGYGKLCALPDTVYGICPPGWHLPTNTEWNTLFTVVGGKLTAGKVLKSQTGWLDYQGTGDYYGTDALGFSALPAGYRFSNGYSYNVGGLAFFWSASDSLSDKVYYIYLYFLSWSVYLDSNDKDYALSVRCLKNKP